MRALARRTRTFLRMSAARRRLFLQAWRLMPLTYVALRTLGFRRVRAAIERRPPGPAGRGSDSTMDVVEMVRLAATWAPVPVNCLLRSLVLVRLLRQRGIEADLRFGVRKGSGRFEAHAWVERAGVVLNDAPDVALRYRAFSEPITIPPGQWR